MFVRTLPSVERSISGDIQSLVVDEAPPRAEGEPKTIFYAGYLYLFSAGEPFPKKLNKRGATITSLN